MSRPSKVETQSNATSNGEDIFNRAANLGTNQIVACIKPERRTADRFGQHLAHLRISAGKRHSRRQAMRDISGETGTGQHRTHTGRNLFSQHICHQAERGLLNPLRAQNNRQAIARILPELLQSRAHMLRRYNRKHDLGISKISHIRARPQSRVQPDAGQIGRIDMLMIDPFGAVRLECPQHGVMTIARQKVCQSRPPCAAAKNTRSQKNCSNSVSR